MEHEGSNPYRDPTSSAMPNDRPARWKVPRAAVTIGVAALLGMAGAGVAYAATGSGRTTPSGSLASSSNSTTPSKPAGPPAGRHAIRGWGPGGGPGAMRRGVLHGIFTVKNGSGYLTEQVQVGVVRAGNSDTSITVTSKDSYSQTYTVQPSTVVDSQAGGISSVQAGDRVRVEAVQKNGGSYTATDIVDLNQIASSRKGFGIAPPGPPPSTGTKTTPAA